jgi:hypothetical protein
VLTLVRAVRTIPTKNLLTQKNIIVKKII